MSDPRQFDPKIPKNARQAAWKRVGAVALTAALLVTAPGLGCYQALAMVRVVVPVKGPATGPAGISVSRQTLMGGLRSHLNSDAFRSRLESSFASLPVGKRPETVKIDEDSLATVVEVLAEKGGDVAANFDAAFEVAAYRLAARVEAADPQELAKLDREMTGFNAAFGTMLGGGARIAVEGALKEAQTRLAAGREDRREDLQGRAKRAAAALKRSEDVDIPGVTGVDADAGGYVGSRPQLAASRELARSSQRDSGLLRAGYIDRPGAARVSAAFSQIDSKTPAELDITSDNLIYTPGLDSRMVPAVESFLQGSQDLPHLRWALQEFLSKGGTLRYAGTNNGAYSLLESEQNAIFLNLSLVRVDTRLQAALLAARLQEYYDSHSEVDRHSRTQEANIRHLRAFDTFLAQFDAKTMAEELDLANDVGLQLFEDALNDRIDVANGLNHLGSKYRDIPRAEELYQSVQFEVESYQRELASFERQRKGLRFAVQNTGSDPENAQDLEAIETQIASLEARRDIQAAFLATLKKDSEKPEGAHYLDTPLSVSKKHAVRSVDFKKHVFQAKANLPKQEKVEAIYALLEKTIKAPVFEPTRKLGYLLEALAKFKQQGGQSFFGPTEPNALAYVMPVLFQLVVGFPMAKLHPMLLAAIVGHELAHVSDMLGVPRYAGEAAEPRSLTRETEEHAFEVEAIIASNFDPRKIAAEVNARPDLYDKNLNSNILRLVYAIVRAHRQGQVRVIEMVAELYREIFGSQIYGLSTARQYAEELETTKIQPELYKIDTLKRRARARQAEHSQLGQDAILLEVQAIEFVAGLREAKLRAYERRRAQLERSTEDRDRRRAKPIAKPPAQDEKPAEPAADSGARGWLSKLKL